MSGGFLARWALRKEAVRAAERAKLRPEELDDRSAPAVEDGFDPASATIAAPLPAETEPETGQRSADEPDDVLAALPPLETLTAQTDLTPFLRAGVPAVLRNAALRRMWSLDPGIRDFVSEAREYAYDWNTPGGVPGLGPLLPSDDVKAMLSRMLDPRPDKATVEEAEQEAPAPEAEDLSGEDTHEDTHGERGHEPAPDPPGSASEALPSAADAGGLVSAAPDTGGPRAVPVSAAAASEDPPIRPRLRRHGGAMPA